MQVLTMAPLSPQVRVSPSKFEAYLHEYGVEAGQHGLPRMHAGFVLDFARDDVSQEMKVSRMNLDIDYASVALRASDFKEVGADVQLSRAL